MPGIDPSVGRRSVRVHRADRPHLNPHGEPKPTNLADYIHTARLVAVHLPENQDHARGIW